MLRRCFRWVPIFQMGTPRPTGGERLCPSLAVLQACLWDLPSLALPCSAGRWVLLPPGPPCSGIKGTPGQGRLPLKRGALRYFPQFTVGLREPTKGECRLGKCLAQVSPVPGLPFSPADCPSLSVPVVTPRRVWQLTGKIYSSPTPCIMCIYLSVRQRAVRPGLSPHLD